MNAPYHKKAIYCERAQYVQRIKLSRDFESKVVGSKRAPAINPWKSRCAKIIGKKRALDASAQLFWCFLRHGMLNLPEYC